MRRRIRSAALPLHRYIARAAGRRRSARRARVLPRLPAALQQRASAATTPTCAKTRSGGSSWSSVVVLTLFRVYQRRYRFAGQRDYETLVKAVIVIVLLTAVAIEVLRPGRSLPAPQHGRGGAAQRGDRPLRAARDRVPGRSAGARPQHLRAPPAGGLPRRRPRPALGADRRRRRGRADGASARSCATASSGWRRSASSTTIPHKRGLRIDGVPVRGEHRGRPAADPRRGRARRSDHRDPLGAGLHARAHRPRVPHARRSRCGPCRRVFELLQTRGALARQVREVRVEDVLGREPVHMELDRVGAYLTGAGRARHRRRRIDRRRAVPPDRARRSPTASCSSTTPRTTSSRSSASSRTSATCRPRCWRRCSPTARRRSACGRSSPSTARRSSSTPPPTSTWG